jgi:hypothetical protein
MKVENPVLDMDFWKNKIENADRNTLSKMVEDTELDDRIKNITMK